MDQMGVDRLSSLGVDSIDGRTRGWPEVPPASLTIAKVKQSHQTSIIFITATMSHDGAPNDSGEDDPVESYASDDGSELGPDSDDNQKKPRVQFVRGPVGQASALVVRADIFTGKVKKELYRALEAAGIVRAPVRSIPGDSEEDQKLHEQEDQVRAHREEKLRQEGGRWSRAAARAISACARALNRNLPAELVVAQGKLRGEKPKHWRFHGPAIDELEFWDAYEHYLYRNFTGGKNAWQQQVESVMWNSYDQAHVAHLKKKAQQKEDRKNKKQRQEVEAESKSAASDAAAATASGPAPAPAPPGVPPLANATSTTNPAPETPQFGLPSVLGKSLWTTVVGLGLSQLPEEAKVLEGAIPFPCLDPAVVSPRGSSPTSFNPKRL